MKINSVYPYRELDIKCKGLHNEERANSKDLVSVLNEISLVYSQAARYNREHGSDVTATEYEEKADKLYQICKELGAYDD